MTMRKTDQEVFDIVSRHLLTQGRASLSSRGRCLYRGPFDTKCAIGVLIPDEDYSPQLEGLTVTSVPVRNILQKHGFNPHSALLYQLQGIHDNIPVEMWSGYLLKLAEAFSLRFTAP